jgi:hypothetical protein
MVRKIDGGGAQAQPSIFPFLCVLHTGACAAPANRFTIAPYNDKGEWLWLT